MRSANASAAAVIFNAVPPLLVALVALRHAHATLMLTSGVHPKIVSERLGHASSAITLDTYSHVLPGLQVAAAEQLDALLGEPEALPNAR